MKLICIYLNPNTKRKIEDFASEPAIPKSASVKFILNEFFIQKEGKR